MSTKGLLALKSSCYYMYVLFIEIQFNLVNVERPYLTSTYGDGSLPFNYQSILI